MISTNVAKVRAESIESSLLHGIEQGLPNSTPFDPRLEIVTFMAESVPGTTQRPTQISRQLALVAKHYASLSPSTPALLPSPPFPSNEELSLPETQSWLVDNLLNRESVVHRNERRVRETTDEGSELEDAELEDESASMWKKVFWRRVAKGIEEGYSTRASGGVDVNDEEVHEEILEAVVRYLPAQPGPPGRSLRRYFWGPIKDMESWKNVTTLEEGKRISEGTTGLRTWHACIALSNHLIHDPSLVTSSDSIIELGAGVGLLSLVAAKLNQSSKSSKIIATDVDEGVLQRLEKNVELNNLETQVKVSQLNWNWASNPGSLPELENWKSKHLANGSSRLILGADIVYDPTLAKDLASTLAVLLQEDSASESIVRPKPLALIACTIRNESTWINFLQRCHECELQTRLVPLNSMGDDGIVGGEGWEGEGEVRLINITAP
ncbi:hypothetical protein T439DRAFT_17368 [Meredithblackwellia eburnea MCA 4105]